MPTLRSLPSRRTILRLHLIVALAAGAFLVVLGATGCVMAFEDELDRLLNRGLFEVQPGPAPLPVAAVQAALAKAYPDGHFNGLRIPTAPGEAYQAQQRSLQVFIDGYRGTVIGTRATPTVLQRIHQFHTSLAMGTAGHVAVGCAAAALLLLVVSGIHLWWPRKRMAVAFRAPAQQVIMDLHHVLGIATAAFLLVLGVSGLAISLGDAWRHGPIASPAPRRRCATCRRRRCPAPPPSAPTRPSASPGRRCPAPPRSRSRARAPPPARTASRCASPRISLPADAAGWSSTSTAARRWRWSAPAPRPR
jgi:uncharacterized iron-regulated membrane protein